MQSQTGQNGIIPVWHLTLEPSAREVLPVPYTPKLIVSICTKKIDAVGVESVGARPLVGPPGAGTEHGGDSGVTPRDPSSPSSFLSSHANKRRLCLGGRFNGQEWGPLGGGGEPGIWHSWVTTDSLSSQTSLFDTIFIFVQCCFF